MEKETTTLSYYYTLTPEWQQQVVDQLGAQLIDGKIMIYPSAVASGRSIFLEVVPGLSVFLLDMTFHIPVVIRRIVTDQHCYMAYYDLGDDVTTHVLNDTVHRVGYRSKLGMGFMDAGIEGVIIPPVNERSYSLRLIIDKGFVKRLFAPNREEAITEALFDDSKNTLFFYSHIDSRSKLMLNDLRGHSFDSSSFELRLKSIALCLLGYLVERATRFEPIINKLSQPDIDSIMMTSDYMLKNLRAPFPGLNVLSEMAGMSISKYKVLFRKILKNSPNNFFLNGKLLVAQQLLLSGYFKTVTEVAYELSYHKVGYFASAYKKMFGVSPKVVLRRAC